MRGLAGPWRIGWVCAGLLSVLPLAPAIGEQWWSLPLGDNARAVTAVYVEKLGITKSVTGKYAWIFKTLDTSDSPYATLEERLDVDCLHPRYRRLLLRWTDPQGRATASDQEDEVWNYVLAGSAEESVRAFVCAHGPTPGSVPVKSVLGGR